jgi:hypothetical protein
LRPRLRLGLAEFEIRDPVGLDDIVGAAERRFAVAAFHQRAHQPGSAGAAAPVAKRHAGIDVAPIGLAANDESLACGARRDRLVGGLSGHRRTQNHGKNDGKNAVLCGLVQENARVKNSMI